MVKLTKIYTKVGDGGQTMLGDASRVSKTDSRVEAYGAVDEANAAIGLAVGSLNDAGSMAESRDELLRIQHDLFDLGADLCCPLKPGEVAGAALRITDTQINRLEAAIDGINARLESLNSFVLPGGTESAARLHLARTVTRRAERRIAALLERDPAGTSPKTLIYVNRLSDLLFVMARQANDQGRKDVLWKPGANRS